MKNRREQHAVRDVWASALGFRSSPSASPKKRHEKRDTRSRVSFFLETPGFLNRGSRICSPMPYHLAMAPKKWSGQRDSNSLPPPWQGGALPNELCPQNGASGRNRTNDTGIFSPLLYRLSYRGVCNSKTGGNNRARTCDPLLVRQVLSRLSYAPVSQLAHYTRRQKNCQGIFGNFFFGNVHFRGGSAAPNTVNPLRRQRFSASSSVCSSAGVKTYSASQNWQCTCVFLPSAIMSCSSCTPHWRSACSTRAREHAQR